MTTNLPPTGRVTIGPGIVEGGRGPEFKSVVPTPEHQEGEGCSGPVDIKKPILRRRVAPSRNDEGMGWGKKRAVSGENMKALMEQ